ncbi:MAG: flavin reductase family protein [Natronosporangium sp.]
MTPNWTEPGGHPPPAAESSFRRTARRCASSVTVVTTAGNGVVDGVTVSAFTTLSIRPLLVLVALGSHGLFLRRLLASRAFAVNILASHQEDIARYFSDVGRSRTLPAFPNIEMYAGSTGVPILDGCLGYFDCAVADARRYGDHHLVVGDVRDVASSTGAPLLHYDGHYHWLAGHQPRQPAASRVGS